MSGLERDYDALAGRYAEHLADELAHKPFDRACLDAFAGRWTGRGTVADLGCGPGQIAAYLAARGVAMTGIDLSAGMIAEARRRHPGIAFETGDMLGLGRAPGRFAAAVAFYSLVHFDDAALSQALAAIRAALAPGGELLAAVHLGEGWLAPGSMWDIPVGLRFRQFAPEEVQAALQAAGFVVDDAQLRDPYVGAEYPSRRGYFRATVPPAPSPGVPAA